MAEKNELSLYLKNISLFLLGIFFFSFPLIFTNSTTDWFVLPKQFLLAITILILIIILAGKIISEGELILKRTLFDLPLCLLALSVLASSFFAINRFDSIIAVVPFLFSILIFFALTNTVKDKASFLLVISSLTAGGVILSVMSIISYFKIYILPFEFTHSQSFTPLGTLLDQAVYLTFLLLLSIYFIFRVKEKKDDQLLRQLFFLASFFVILAGISLSLYQIFIKNPPNSGLPVLPFATGFQTAFAAISQDSGRIIQGFLFGSGFGTYITDFTRFKQPFFNNSDIWYLSFLRSSSFILELLATTGFLGFAAFSYLIIKILKDIKTNILLSLPLVFGILALFLLPVSFVIQTLFFIILGFFSVIHKTSSYEQKFFSLKLHFAKNEERSYTRMLPLFLLVFSVLFSSIIGYYTVKYVKSDIIFQNSIIAASNNNLFQTYNDQLSAIQIFPYRDSFYRVYSQTNLALANPLNASMSNNSTASAETQKTIYSLIQQSIKSAKYATALSPQTALNWQNLSSIYRSLTGLENTGSFALLSQQQAIILDPNNPQNYINLGGIYYQLSQWENAEAQFRIATSLKPDLANAYYNLGHALEQKEDLKGALAQYETVKKLAKNSPDQIKIQSEIEILQKRIDNKNAKIENAQPVKEEANKASLKLSIRPEIKISSFSAGLPDNLKLMLPPPQLNISPKPTP